MLDRVKGNELIKAEKATCGNRYNPLRQLMVDIDREAFVFTNRLGMAIRFFACRIFMKHTSSQFEYGDQWQNDTIWMVESFF